ncbi:hypothetical protein [Aquamicrobium soli]|uniref:Uncharacterized protein n=1 Tax=Aquamicrobium soli TaxID=1811518 RepID=A0ABV7K443_9HYPH
MSEFGERSRLPRAYRLELHLNGKRCGGLAEIAVLNTNPFP